MSNEDRILLGVGPSGLRDKIDELVNRLKTTGRPNFAVVGPAGVGKRSISCYIVEHAWADTSPKILPAQELVRLDDKAISGFRTVIVTGAETRSDDLRWRITDLLEKGHPQVCLCLESLPDWSGTVISAAHSLIIPPLHERRGDLLELAAYFLQIYAPQCTVTPFAVQFLSDYPWPYGVAQMRSVLRDAADNARSQQPALICTEHLCELLVGGPGFGGKTDALPVAPV